MIDKKIPCEKCKGNTIFIKAESGPRGLKYRFICKCGNQAKPKDTFDKALTAWNSQEKTDDGNKYSN